MGERVALCMFGKIGDFRETATSLPPSGHNQSVVAYASLAHSTVNEHLLLPNRRAGLSVHVFLHSWNPLAGPSLDRLYQPRASLHQQPQPQHERVRSAHLSLKRVLQLVRQHESAAGGFSLVMLSRFDVVWYRDLLMRGLRPTHIWLPHYCMPVLGGAKDEAAAIESLCRSDRGALAEPVYAQRFFGVRLQREVNYNSFVLDYWFISSLEVAESFADIYVRHSEYTEEMSARLGGYRPFASHFFWTFHISKLLARSKAEYEAGRTSERLRVGFITQAEIDFNLCRYYSFGNDCLVDTSPIRSKIAARVKAMSAKLEPNPFVSSQQNIGLALVTEVSTQQPGNTSASTVERNSFPRRNVKNASWLIHMCPHSLVKGLSVQCPWYSARCGREMQRRVREMLLFAESLRNAVTT
ncbi:hypothetical protein AB1Y20_010688 [Prymnesium parvum]|uniref:Protein xylosyltransferase n=1 Tax=Prymnesium parvum TaxID=97485 RepID=A0AB34IS37_PRYPA